MNRLSGTRTMCHSDHWKRLWIFREHGHMLNCGPRLRLRSQPRVTTQLKRFIFMKQKRPPVPPDPLLPSSRKVFGYNYKSKWHLLELQCTTSETLHGSLEPSYRKTKWLLPKNIRWHLEDGSRRDRWGQTVRNEKRGYLPSPKPHFPAPLSDVGEIHA